MARVLEKYQLVERSITKKYRKELWNPFVECVKQYGLVEENSVIAISLNGNARTTLAGKLFQHLKRISQIPFEIVFIDDGIDKKMADEMNMPLSNFVDNCIFVDTVVFDDVVNQTLKGIFYQSKIETFLPKYKKDGIQYINPLYCIKNDKINAWLNYNSLDLPNDLNYDKQSLKIYEIINNLKNTEQGIEESIFKSVHAVCLDTMVGYNENSTNHFYIDNY